MSRTSILGAITVVALCGVSPLAQESILAQESLFRPLSTNHAGVLAWDVEQRGSDSTIADTQFVAFDASALRRLADGERRILSLDLFGDRQQVVFRYFQHQLQHATYVGQLPGAETSVVLAVHPAGTAAGMIEIAGEHFALNYTGVGGVHALHRLDPSQTHPHPVCGVNEAQLRYARSETLPATVASPAPPAASGLDVTDEIDVMVFYTSASKNSQGGQTAIENLIAARVASTNVAAVSSSVDYNMRLVYVAETLYSETGGSADVNRFRNANDGYMDEVHGLRNQYGGDLMALITNFSSSFCGIAFSIMCTPSRAFSPNAYSVSVRGCLGSNVFAHELGHTMGCAHDRGNAGCGAYSYWYGARSEGSPLYRSIMAYSPGSWVNKWSGPDILHNGQVLGTPTEDNARTLRQVKSIIASFRPTQLGVPAPNLTGINPAAVANYSPQGLRNVTLTGVNMLSVYQVTMNGQDISSRIGFKTDTTVTFSVPDGTAIGSYVIQVGNGAGTSNTVGLDVTGSHPSVLAAPFLHSRQTTHNYATYTDAGWVSLYLISALNTPSVVPGIVSFEIGGAFSNLVQVITVAADAEGKVDLPLTMPLGVPVPFTLYWECMTYDPNNLVAPIETSNSVGVLTFF